MTTSQFNTPSVAVRVVSLLERFAEAESEPYRKQIERGRHPTQAGDDHPAGNLSDASLANDAAPLPLDRASEHLTQWSTVSAANASGHGHPQPYSEIEKVPGGRSLQEAAWGSAAVMMLVQFLQSVTTAPANGGADPHVGMVGNS
jgi:hypothetical protein